MDEDHKVYQEFYCRRTGGGCGGYVLFKLNIGINGVVEVVCPKCGHKHQRCIKDGVIIEDGRFNGKPTQEICPTMAAWNKNPRVKQSATLHENGNAAVARDATDFVAESWMERFGVWPRKDKPEVAPGT